jgi:hypothetical protein
VCAGRLSDAFKCRERTNRSLAHCCPTPINHERLATSARSQREDYFHCIFNNLLQIRTVATLTWHGARSVVQRAAAQTLNQLNILTLFRRTEMKIENLSKELDTETMTEVRGGLALTGQVVPTNVQSNELLQNFDIASKGPVAISNDTDQSNYSDQESFVPVGSIFLTPSLGKLVR